jgi:hypothetical protein
MKTGSEYEGGAAHVSYVSNLGILVTGDQVVFGRGAGFVTGDE